MQKMYRIIKKAKRKQRWLYSLVAILRRIYPSPYPLFLFQLGDASQVFVSLKNLCQEKTFFYFIAPFLLFQENARSPNRKVIESPQPLSQFLQFVRLSDIPITKLNADSPHATIFRQLCQELPSNIVLGEEFISVFDCVNLPLRLLGKVSVDLDTEIIDFMKDMNHVLKKLKFAEQNKVEFGSLKPDPSLNAILPYLLSHMEPPARTEPFIPNPDFSGLYFTRTIVEEQEEKQQEEEEECYEPQNESQNDDPSPMLDLEFDAMPIVEMEREDTFFDYIVNKSMGQEPEF